ncbi:MAG: sigma-70 family RNA polymerase sigma factor [Candidatus Aenigmatarchaeota archaeon]
MAYGKTNMKSKRKPSNMKYKDDDFHDLSRDNFIEKQQPLVYSIAKKNIDKGVDIDDLIQEGNIGLNTAYEKFDSNRGIRFSTYATWWIRAAIDDIILKQGDTINKPSNYGSSLKTLINARTKLKTEGRDPGNIPLLAKRSNMKENMINGLLNIISGTLSLDVSISSGIGGDDSLNYIDALVYDDDQTPEDQTLARTLREELDQMIDTLEDERDQTIMRLRFFKNQSLREVGKECGLTCERIRQIEKVLLGRLRKVNPDLREYLMVD